MGPGKNALHVRNGAQVSGFGFFIIAVLTQHVGEKSRDNGHARVFRIGRRDASKGFPVELDAGCKILLLSREFGKMRQRHADDGVVCSEDSRFDRQRLTEGRLRFVKPARILQDGPEADQMRRLLRMVAPDGFPNLEGFANPALGGHVFFHLAQQQGHVRQPRRQIQGRCVGRFHGALDLNRLLEICVREIEVSRRPVHVRERLQEVSAGADLPERYE